MTAKKTQPEPTTDQPVEVHLTSEPLPEPPAPLPLVALISRISAEVGAVRKTQQAPGNIGGYQFRGIDAVVNALHPVLAKYGVIVLPKVLEVERATATTKNGGTMLNVYVTTQFTLYGPAGDSLEVITRGEAADAGDKATSKAQSVALRVALLQAFMLPTDEPDPDSQGYERAGAEGAAIRGHQGRARRDEQPAPEEPTRQPHQAQFWEAFDALDVDQQAWVEKNWPAPYQPHHMTVEQSAKALEWVVTNVPPA